MARVQAPVDVGLPRVEARGIASGKRVGQGSVRDPFARWLQDSGAALSTRLLGAEDVLERVAVHDDLDVVAEPQRFCGLRGLGPEGTRVTSEIGTNEEGVAAILGAFFAGEEAGPEIELLHQ